MAEQHAFEVVPMQGRHGFGAEVFGLERNSLGNPKVAKALRDLWIEKGVLVFRGVTGPDFQIELSKCFGELIEHPTKEARSLRPELSSARFTPDDGNIDEVDGELRANWLPWHTDLFYKPWINRGGILHVLSIPSRLGRTGYIDKVQTYKTLPEYLKKAIETLGVRYKTGLPNDKYAFLTNKVRTLRIAKGAQGIMDRSGDFPTVVHPMVFTHSDLGIKCLNAAPSKAMGIDGMMNDEGDDLLREVLKYATNEDLAYYHDWRPDDMVLWDNWRMLHCATGSPIDEERWIQRTTIVGDYGFGRVADEGQPVKETVTLDG